MSVADMRSGTAILRETGMRIGLVAPSLVALSAADHRFRVWRQTGLAAFRYSAAGWVLWLALVSLAGLLFGLAVMLPTTTRYRVGPHLLLVAVPLLMLGQAVVSIGLGWNLPGKLGITRFYMEPPVQFALATMLGLALAPGFRSGRPRP